MKLVLKNPPSSLPTASIPKHMPHDEPALAEVEDTMSRKLQQTRGKSYFNPLMI
jgi:hypothetical protein